MSWKRFDRGMEVSGYHHNVRGGFLMLQPGLYAAGVGEARFANFTYRAFDSERVTSELTFVLIVNCLEAPSAVRREASLPSSLCFASHGVTDSA